MDPPTHPTRSLTASDIQRKVISTRIVSNPRFPLSAPWVAHAKNQRLYGFKRETKGEYKAFCIGGVALSKKRKSDTRVETANEGRFSSRSERGRVEYIYWINPTDWLTQ